jgi:hypothetical protein
MFRSGRVMNAIRKEQYGVVSKAGRAGRKLGMLGDRDWVEIDAVPPDNDDRNAPLVSAIGG